MCVYAEATFCMLCIFTLHCSWMHGGGYWPNFYNQQEGHYQIGNIAAAITSHCQRIIVHGKGVKEHVMMEDKRVSAKRWKLKNKSRKTFQVTIAIRLNVIRGRDYPMQSEKHWSWVTLQQYVGRVSFADRSFGQIKLHLILGHTFTCCHR